MPFKIETHQFVFLNTVKAKNATVNLKIGTKYLPSKQNHF